MVKEKQTKLHWLCMYYPDQMKATGVKTFENLVNRFIKNDKFIRFVDDQFRRYHLCNFNIAVAELLFKEGYISKIERLKQKSLYGYQISAWNHKVFKENNLTYLGEAVERCIKKDGSFKPIGGKGKTIATNYKIASILRKEGFLSEKSFLMVHPPKWKHRRLTEKELGESGGILINISKWPTDTLRIIGLLHRRQNDLSWDRYKKPLPKLKFVTLKFLAEEFLRIPPDSDLPVFKSEGHRINRAFATTWTSKDLEEALEIVRKTLKENNFL